MVWFGASSQTNEAIILENEKEAKRFEEDTARMQVTSRCSLFATQLRQLLLTREWHCLQAEIAALTSEPQIFQQSKCAACNYPLDLPTVNFLCKHSFHQSCLGEADHECMLCAPQRRRVRDHLQQQQHLAVSHDDFFKQVNPRVSAGSRWSEIRTISVHLLSSACALQTSCELSTFSCPPAFIMLSSCLHPRLLSLPYSA